MAQSEITTPNYGLNQYSPTETLTWERFTEDNNIIDGALADKANLSNANFESLKRGGYDVLDLGKPQLLFPATAIVLPAGSTTEISRMQSSQYTLSAAMQIAIRVGAEQSTSFYLLNHRTNAATKISRIGYVNHSETQHVTISAAVENYVSTTNYQVVIYATTPSGWSGYAATVSFGLNSGI